MASSSPSAIPAGHDAHAALQAALIDATSYSIIATGINGIIEIFNAGAERMLGYSAAEMIGLQSPAIIHDPEEVVAHAADLSQRLGRVVEPGFTTFIAMADLGGEDAHQWTYIRKDGSRLQVLLKVTAVRDRAGVITGYLGIAEDISERLRQEARLDNSRQRLSSIFTAMTEGLVMQDVSGRIVEWNASAERILGLTAEQMQGRDSLDPRWRAIRQDGSPFPGEDHPAMQCLRSGAPVRNVVMGVHKPDGTLSWISINCQPVLGEDGNMVAVVSSFADITHRKNQDQQLRSSMIEIINLKSALDEHAIVAVTDAKGVITYVNERFCRISGYSSQELIGKTHRILNSGRHPKEHFKNLWRFILSGHVWRSELCNRAKDGTPYCVETTIVPFLGDNGEPEQFISISTDITERKRLEADLAQARDAALESSRLKSEFLATMSHEIRTPMNGVIGMTELLLDSLTEESQVRMGRTIESCARSLMVILNDILDFSKIEAGHLEIHPEAFVPLELMQQTIGLFEPRAREKGLQLGWRGSPGMEDLRLGDAARIRQVLSNLLGNAIKFTEQGSVSVEVDILPAASPGGASRFRFSVVDTGIGISAPMLGKLFMPFIQADGSVTRRFGGTGLGLAISKRLVELMHGIISAESQEGRGSRFWFEIELPTCEGAAALFIPSPMSGAAAGLSPVGQGTEAVAVEQQGAAGAAPGDAASQPAEEPWRPSILVVEDNDVNQTLVKLMLGRLGLVAEIANNGEEALSCLARARYDIVLLDCQMPVMDGYEAARIIRSGRRVDIPRDQYIIALTAYAMADDRQRCLDAGMDDYLTKPISVAELKDALGRARTLLAYKY